MRIKQCQICGGDYEVRSNNSKYCKACAAQKQRACVRAYSHAKYWADATAARERSAQIYRANKAARQRYNAAYYSEHKAEIAARRKAQRQQGKEQDCGGGQ